MDMDGNDATGKGHSAKAKALPIGAVLTITTDVVMVEGFAGVHEAFEWIMGHPVWTHEMPRYGDAARDLVLAQHPDVPTKATSDNWRQVLASATSRFGDTIMLNEGDALREADPITTLLQARGEVA